MSRRKGWSFRVSVRGLIRGGYLWLVLSRGVLVEKGLPGFWELCSWRVWSLLPCFIIVTFFLGEGFTGLKLEDASHRL